MSPILLASNAAERSQSALDGAKLPFLHPDESAILVTNPSAGPEGNVQISSVSTASKSIPSLTPNGRTTKARICVSV